jgi:hypothetical protein
MNTTLYRIPNKYFPGVFVKKPFHAKVNYEVKAGVVIIFDVCLSPLCLTHIDNTKGMIEEMKEILTKAERKQATLASIHPTIANAIAPHI